MDSGVRQMFCNELDDDIFETPTYKEKWQL